MVVRCSASVVMWWTWGGSGGLSGDKETGTFVVPESHLVVANHGFVGCWVVVWPGNVLRIGGIPDGHWLFVSFTAAWRQLARL